VAVSRWYYGAAVVFTSMACAGVIFGFPNLAVMLARAGFFSSQCDGVSNCSSQQLALNGLFSAGSIVSFVSPSIVGVILTRFGPRPTLFLTSGVFALGAAFGVAAAATHSDGLWYASLVCLGFSAQSLVLPLYSYANMFPGNQGLALGILNGSFDASTLVCAVMSALYSAGVSLTTIFVAYLAGPVTVLLLHAVFLWPQRQWQGVPEMSPADPKGDQPSGRANMPAHDPDCEAPVEPTQSTASVTASVTGMSEADRLSTLTGVHAVTVGVPDSNEPNVPAPLPPLPPVNPADHHAPPSAGDEHRGHPVADSSVVLQLAVRGAGQAKAIAPASAADEPLPSAREACASAVNPAPLPNGSSAAGPAPIAAVGLPSILDRTAGGGVGAAPQSSAAVIIPALVDAPISRQLRSPPFLWYAAFFIINMCCYTCWLGTLDARLNALGQVNGEQTAIFGIIAPLGFFVQFIVGPTMDRAGVKVAAWIQWALGALFLALSAVQDLQVQIGAMVAFVCFRAFHFSVMASYLSRAFGFRTMGVTVGTVVLLGGLAGLSQSGFLLWGLSSSEGFLPPILLLLTLQVLSVAFPLWLSGQGGKDGTLPPTTGLMSQLCARPVSCYLRAGGSATHLGKVASVPECSPP
jgi:hypothetical protein